ncbi:MAG: hypothetical protein ACOYM8_18165 [Caulobacterales bacterium]
MRNKLRKASILALLAALGLVAPASAETTLRLSTGVDFSSGKYGGTDRTDVIVAPLSAKVSSGSWAVRATVPVLSIRGRQSLVLIDDVGSGASSGGVSAGPTGDVTSGATGATKTTTGFGDLSLTGTYTFDKVFGAHSYVDVIGRVRLPTGDEGKNLSLGVTDYGLASEVGFIGKKSGAYVLGGRRFLQDAKGLNREDGWQAEIGGWTRAGARSVVGGSIDWRDASTRTGKDVSEASAYVSYKLTEAVRVGVNASAGLTEGASDYGVGLSLSWKHDFGR